MMMMTILKLLGPGTVPCGVPALIAVVLHTDSPIFTNCLRSFKKSSDHTVTCSGMPLLTNLINNVMVNQVKSVRKIKK